MKKFILSLLFIPLCTLLFAQDPLVHLTRFEGQEITGVSVSSGFRVELIPSETPSVTVSMSRELEGDLILNISSEGIITLGLETKNTLSLKSDRKNSVLTAKIYTNNLKSIKASGGSEVAGSAAFSGGSLAIDLSGGANVTTLEYTAENQVIITASGGSKFTGSFTTNLLRQELSGGSKGKVTTECKSLVANLGGASELEISGSADDAIVNTGGASGLKGETLQIKTAKLDSSAASKITVGEIKELTATASSASAIRYRGTPTIQSIKTSSAGSIKSL